MFAEMMRQMSVNAFALIEGCAKKSRMNIPSQHLLSENAQTHAHLAWRLLRLYLFLCAD
jgi:hypothetical protein